MDSDELQYYYALYLSGGIGLQRLIALRTYFGSAEKAFEASAAALARVPGVGKKTAKELTAARKHTFDRARRDLAKLGGDHAVITFFDPDYPETLRNIFNPPAILFIDGNSELLHRQRNVAVIGSRRITDYGKRITADLCGTLASAGVTITSGFAVGVDTAAHRAAFESGGETVAVFGTGIDVIYPPSNKSFAKELIASGRGALVSELPLGTKPDGKNFPWRNRIVSGLTAASIVIESDEHGGSMITASIALDQNREVFALPGDVDRPMSRGPNRLLAENRAKPFRHAEDILRSMEWDSDTIASRSSAKKDRPVLSSDEQRLYDLLETAAEPVHIDALVERSGFDVQTALVKLLELEFKDAIRALPGKYYSAIY